jgi:chromate transport protein ChrA
MCTSTPPPKLNGFYMVRTYALGLGLGVIIQVLWMLGKKAIRSIRLLILAFCLFYILKESKTASSILDGVIVSSLVLMAAVTGSLGRAAQIEPFTVALAVFAGIFLFKFRVNTNWLVLLGAVAGIIAAFFF